MKLFILVLAIVLCTSTAFDEVKPWQKSQEDRVEVEGEELKRLSSKGTAAWIVSGATGRTGMLAFQMLQKSKFVGEVRALVRNETKAKELLGANATVFIGDVTKKSTLEPAFKGADGLVILTSASPHFKDGRFVYPEGGYPKDVDWKGGVNQILLAKKYGLSHVILISTEGTTVPDSFLDQLGDGHISFYKLNAEAFLMESGLPFTIIKPCGLSNPRMLLGSQVGHCDNFKHVTVVPIIARSKVAEFVLHAATDAQELAKSTRFNVCTDPLLPLVQDNFASLFKAARDIGDCKA